LGSSEKGKFAGQSIHLVSETNMKKGRKNPLSDNLRLAKGVFIRKYVFFVSIDLPLLLVPSPTACEAQMLSKDGDAVKDQAQDQQKNPQQIEADEEEIGTAAVAARQ